MKVLVIGEHYSSNLGDGVICQTVKRLLEENFSEIETIDILDISGRTSYATDGNKSFYQKGKLKKMINYLLPVSLKELITFERKAVPSYDEIKKNYDLAIYAGGQLLMPFFLKQMLAINHLLLQRQVPIAYNSVGCGKILSKQLTQKMYTLFENPSIQYISVRDGERYVSKWANQDIIPVICDNAIYANEVYEICKCSDSDLVGLGVMYIEKEKEVLTTFWHDTLLMLEKKDVSWCMFVNGSKEDFLFAQELLQTFGYKDISKHLLPRPENPKELVATIAQFKAIISFRLHSHIIAYSLEIPSIAMVWDEKVRSFFNMVDHLDRCYDYRCYDSDLFIYTLDQLIFTEEDCHRKADLKKEILCNLEKILLIGCAQETIIYE